MSTLVARCCIFLLLTLSTSLALCADLRPNIVLILADNSNVRRVLSEVTCWSLRALCQRRKRPRYDGPAAESRCSRSLERFHGIFGGKTFVGIAIAC